jgi:translation initiation factor 1A
MLLSSEETQLGKRKVLNEAHLKELVLPEQGELLGRVQKISGGNQVLVQCTDGEIRLCRIRGKMKRRMWIREGDIVLISPWDFDHKRADIVWRPSCERHSCRAGGRRCSRCSRCSSPATVRAGRDDLSSSAAGIADRSQ